MLATGNSLPPHFGNGVPVPSAGLPAAGGPIDVFWGAFGNGAIARVIRRRGPWRQIEDVEFATLEWVDWFNNRRLLEPIGNIPPVEFEQAYYQNLEDPARVAGLN